MALFRSCEFCKETGMNEQYYDQHVENCHRPCDKCQNDRMVVIVIAMNPVTSLWKTKSSGFCQKCFDALNLQ